MNRKPKHRHRYRKKIGKIQYPVFLALVLFFAVSRGFAQPVEIERVRVEMEDVGLFTKSRIEILFHNPTDEDSLQATHYVTANRNSFVTGLWLEIDGKLKAAETFSRATGRRIYERVTGKRLDPALLETNGNGGYVLRVFPIMAHQTRRVVIELYAMLDKVQEHYSWRFGLDQPTRITMFLNSRQPERTTFQYDPAVPPRKLPVETKFRLDQARSVTVNFFYPYNGKSYLVHNLRRRFYWQTHPTEAAYRVTIDPTMPPHVILSELVAVTKDHQPADARKAFPRLPYLGQAFVRYLMNRHLADILYQPPEKDGWVRQPEGWEYRQGEIVLTEHPRQKKAVSRVFTCPFLNQFLSYQETLNQEVARQIQQGFLTPATAKVVLEENDRVKKIRDEESSQGKPQYQGFQQIDMDDTNTETTPQEDDNLVPFYSLSRKPEIIRRVDPIYPEAALNAGVEGLVVVKVLIDTTGLVERAEIVKSHPLLDQAAEDAARQFQFKPAQRGNRPVKVWISIPFQFRLSEKNQFLPYREVLANPERADWIDFYGRRFVFTVLGGKRAFLEEGFQPGKALSVAYLSDEHFELLYLYPELLPYSLRYPVCGFRHPANSSKWILIE